MKKLFLVAAASAALALVACSEPVHTADQQRTAQQDQLGDRAMATIGIYHPTHFTRLAGLNMINQMLDDPALVTITYAQSYDGTLRCIGPSVGMPYPAATQITAPQKWEEQPVPSDSSRGRTWDMQLVPQSEPDQTYPSPSTAGDWVMKINSAGVPKPIFVEGNLFVTTPDNLPDASLVVKPCT